MKLLKYEFGVIEIDFLGYRIKVVGVSMNSRKVRIITNWSKLEFYRDI